jgi:hypothetical protein
MREKPEKAFWRTGSLGIDFEQLLSLGSQFKEHADY